MGRRAGQSGFPLVEGMSVVGINGISDPIVLPKVRYSPMRAKIAEVMIAFTKCRTLITELYATGDTKPAGQWGCEDTAASQYVDSIQTTGNGTVIVWIGGTNDLRLDTHRVTMAPLDSTGAVMSGMGNVHSWRCGSPTDGTDLDGKYLPGSCRGL